MSVDKLQFSKGLVYPCQNLALLVVEGRQCDHWANSCLDWNLVSAGSLELRLIAPCPWSVVSEPAWCPITGGLAPPWVYPPTSKKGKGPLNCRIIPVTLWSLLTSALSDSFISGYARERAGPPAVVVEWRGNVCRSVGRRGLSKECKSVRIQLHIWICILKKKKKKKPPPRPLLLTPPLPIAHTHTDIHYISS